jgi:hypothetical protein
MKLPGIEVFEKPFLPKLPVFCTALVASAKWGILFKNIFSFFYFAIAPFVPVC